MTDKTVLRERIAMRVEKLVEKSGKTDREIAIAMGLHDKTIGRWSRGDTSPSLVEAIRFCEYLGISLARLYEKP